MLCYTSLVLHGESHVDPEWQCQLSTAEWHHSFIFLLVWRLFFFFFKLQLKIFCTVFLNSVSHSSQVILAGDFGWKWCGSVAGCLWAGWVLLRCSAVSYWEQWEVQSMQLNYSGYLLGWTPQHSFLKVLLSSLPFRGSCNIRSLWNIL